jgi:hypothetical protein
MHKKDSPNVDDGSYRKVKATAEQLLVRWADRDERYSRSRDALTDDQTEFVRQWRMREVVESSEQWTDLHQRAYGQAAAWTKPLYIRR